MDPNLYGYVQNNPIIGVDTLGLTTLVGRIPYGFFRQFRPRFGRYVDLFERWANEFQNKLPKNRLPKGGKCKNEIPDWLDEMENHVPRNFESGKDFAKRMMRQRYGKGKEFDKGADSEYSKIQKYADHHFERTKMPFIPPGAVLLVAPETKEEWEDCYVLGLCI